MKKLNQEEYKKIKTLYEKISSSLKNPDDNSGGETRLFAEEFFPSLCDVFHANYLEYSQSLSSSLPFQSSVDHTRSDYKKRIDRCNVVLNISNLVSQISNDPSDCKELRSYISDKKKKYNIDYLSNAKEVRDTIKDLDEARNSKDNKQIDSRTHTMLELLYVNIQEQLDPSLDKTPLFPLSINANKNFEFVIDRTKSQLARMEKFVKVLDRIDEIIDIGNNNSHAQTNLKYGEVYIKSLLPAIEIIWEEWNIQQTYRESIFLLYQSKYSIKESKITETTREGMFNHIKSELQNIFNKYLPEKRNHVREILEKYNVPENLLDDTNFLIYLFNIETSLIKLLENEATETTNQKNTNLIFQGLILVLFLIAFYCIPVGLNSSNEVLKDTGEPVQDEIVQNQKQTTAKINPRIQDIQTPKLKSIPTTKPNIQNKKYSAKISVKETKGLDLEEQMRKEGEVALQKKAEAKEEGYTKRIGPIILVEDTKECKLRTCYIRVEAEFTTE